MNVYDVGGDTATGIGHGDRIGEAADGYPKVSGSIGDRYGATFEMKSIGWCTV
jgi:hypothetical protein